MVECLTDNRNRTGAEVRSLFTRNGGSMAEPGAVSWQFHRQGVVLVPKTVAEDDLMLVAADAGAEDLSDDGSHWRVTSPPSSLPGVRAALDESRDHVYQAALLDPNTAATLTTTETVAMCDDLLAAHRDLLPPGLR